MPYLAPHRANLVSMHVQRAEQSRACAHTRVLLVHDARPRLSTGKISLCWNAWAAFLEGELGKIEPCQELAGIHFGGRCEIRTHGAVADTPDFKSGALDRSANLP